MKKAIMLACLGLLISVGVAAPAMAQDLEKYKIVVPRNSVFVLSYFGARDAGVFRKHGFDLEIDARPFKGFLASLPVKETMATTYPGTAAIAKINSGLDWVVIGGGLTVMQEVFVRKDSPFKKIPDMRGKRFSSWSTGAGAFKATRAVIIDGFGMDVLKDTDFVQAAAPALFKLLERGDVDSMFNISSLTVAAAAQPNKYRSIFAPNEYWKKKTGQPIVWSAPIVAWRSWVEEDRDRAKRLVAATHESFRWLRIGKNLDAAVKKYGKLAAVKNQAQAEIYKKWLKAERVYLARWDREVVDAQWEFLEMAKGHGVLKKVPPKDTTAMILE
jgi:ABC-type nitrate/sulfonate/bicarbonate transport system substrate-binding protein